MKSLQVFSANSLMNDPTVLTEDEYLEMTVAEYIDTPFHEFLVSCLKRKSSKNTILSLLAHIKENEVDIMKVYNENFEANRKFVADMEFKNATIEKYKIPRGFPLKLKPSESYLYNMEEGITYSLLEKIKKEKEKEREVRNIERTMVEDDFSNSFSVDTDSCDDEIPFGLETERVRASNPEKRMSKFDPLSSLKLLKSFNQKDVDMSDEEAKSEVSEEEKCNRQSLGGINAFARSSLNTANNDLDSCPFFEATSSLRGLRLERSSHVEGKPSLPTSSILRFSDLEKMDEDVDMEETPERLSFKRS